MHLCSYFIIFIIIIIIIIIITTIIILYSIHRRGPTRTHIVVSEKHKLMFMNIKYTVIFLLQGSNYCFHTTKLVESMCAEIIWEKQKMKPISSMCRSNLLIAMCTKLIKLGFIYSKEISIF
jgi:hypothetical protein